MSHKRFFPLSAAWMVLACLVVPMFASYYFDDMFSSISYLFEDPSLTVLGWDAAGYGLYTSAYSVLCVFGGLVVGGILLDKWGVRITGSLFVGMMVAGAAVVLWALLKGGAWSLQAAYAGGMFFGLGSEIAGTAVTRSIAKWFRDGPMAFAMGLQLAIARLGTAFALVLSPRLVQEQAGHVYSLAETARPALVGMGLMALGLILWAFFVALDARADRHAAPLRGATAQEDEFHFSDILKVLGSPDYFLAFDESIPNLLWSSGSWSLISLLIQDHYPMPDTVTNLLRGALVAYETAYSLDPDSEDAYTAIEHVKAELQWTRPSGVEFRLDGEDYLASYSYDDAGRLLSISLNLINTSDSVFTALYVYDESGRMTQKQLYDDTGERVYERTTDYDTQGHIVSMRLKIPHYTFSELSLNWSYDETNGRLSATSIDTDNVRLRYAYIWEGDRLTSIAVSGIDWFEHNVNYSMLPTYMNEYGTVSFSVLTDEGSVLMLEAASVEEDRLYWICESNAILNILSYPWETTYEYDPETGGLVYQFETYQDKLTTIHMESDYDIYGLKYLVYYEETDEDTFDDLSYFAFMDRDEYGRPISMQFYHDGDELTQLHYLY